MKTLHCIESLNPAHGGPVQAVLQLASAMERFHGAKAEILTLDAPSAEWGDSYGLIVHRMGPGRGTFGLSPRMREWLHQNILRYQIVLIHGLWRYHAGVTARICVNENVPYFLFPHGMLNPWLNRGFGTKQITKWAAWLASERQVVRSATGVIFNSQEESRLAAQPYFPYSARSFVVPFGMEEPPAAAASDLFAAFPELRGQRLFTFLGRLHAAKACDHAIEAFAHCAPANSRLVMAGPDSYGLKSALVALGAGLGIADRITWTGAIEGARKWELLRASEILLLPSHCESMGYVALEAIACGTPVLISDKVNIYRELDAAGCALVDSDTAEGTTRSLRHWLALPDQEKEQMRLAARRAFVEKYNIRPAVSLLVSFLGSQVPTDAVYT